MRTRFQQCGIAARFHVQTQQWFGVGTTQVETPLAEGASIAFTLNRQNAGVNQEVIRTGYLTAVNGKFAVKDLRPGHYNWSLSYPLAKVSANQVGVHQSGAFELIALPTAAP